MSSAGLATCPEIAWRRPTSSRHVQPSPEFWLAVKQRYNRAGRLGKRHMELWYVWELALYRRLTHVPAPIRRIAGCKHSHGMAFYHDVVDWLGGWPMAFARRADVKARKRSLRNTGSNSSRRIALSKD